MDMTTSACTMHAQDCRIGLILELCFMHPTQSLTVTLQCSFLLSCSCKRSAPALLKLSGIMASHSMTLLHTACKHALAIEDESPGLFEAKKPKRYKGNHCVSKPHEA